MIYYKRRLIIGEKENIKLINQFQIINKDEEISCIEKSKIINLIIFGTNLGKLYI